MHKPTPPPLSLRRYRPQPGGVVHKSIELLYDYTKFHIGVYLTVSGAYITAAFANIGGNPVLPLNLYLLLPALGFTALAGLAGGVIVSSLTQWQSGNSMAFLASEIGPYEFRKARFIARHWTWLEHTSFWLGLLAAGLSFAPRAFWLWLGLPSMVCGYR